MIILVYLTGMFVPLFEYDSAQFAVMAMRMVQENDFINLFKGTGEYLDKPHMHYWLAALSYKVFGIHDWAYRIPGFLATLLGAYSCYGLAKLLYNEAIGKFASLIFMTAQTIVLAVIDVRTDAVLTGFTIFAIWQLVTYIEHNTVKNIALGAFGAGIAFSTKGQIALLVIGISILCHLAYTRKWNRFLNWRVVVALVVFIAAISPMLYAYYLQFDLHPEKVIRGKSNRSGIFFIFWEQSFERLSGEGHGKNSSDYFFFFHTFLWIFLPWTMLALFAYWWRVKTFIKSKFKYHKKFEFLTVGGISIIFFIISFAQFKLPHYMNIMMPLYAILTASYVHSLYSYSKKKAIKALLVVQYCILGLVFVFSALICFNVFKFQAWYSYLLLIITLAIIIYFYLKREAYYTRIITLSVCSSLLLNGVLNTHFYPNLLEYQAGYTIAQKIKTNNIPTDKIYKVTEMPTWALDFYNKKPVIPSSLTKISNMEDIWVYVDDAGLESLRKSGFDWDRQLTEKQFRITRLQLKFLNPTTRDKVLRKMHLVHIY